MKAHVHIALLRGINVGGRARVPMADLRELCEQLGWTDVGTYVQSGNVVLKAAVPRTRIESMLERALEERFALDIPVIVRDVAQWQACVAGNPWPDVAATEPNLLMLAVSKRRPEPTALDVLRERAAGGERVQQCGDAFWIHYDRSVAGSKLSPGLLDRAIGSPVTTRNWRTVLRLQEMATALM